MTDYDDIASLEDDIPNWGTDQDEESKTESGTDTNTGTPDTGHQEPFGKFPHCGG
jgi:hypothetical protein